MYFCRIDRLKDPFEGTLPAISARAAEAANAAWYRPEGNFNMPLPERIMEMTRNTVFVNCWHMNEAESAAMWQIYGTDSPSIAVQTSYRRLRDCFATYPKRINIGVVQYIDFRSAFVNPYCVLDIALVKRRSFDHERELRVFVGSDGDPKQIELGLPTVEGVEVPVDLDQLIEVVYVSPTAPRWFGPLVEAMMRRYGCEKPIVCSDLYQRLLA